MANSQSVQQIQQEQTERQQWAGLDPVTLVAAARKSLYSQIPSGNGGDLPVSVSAPLEELITRFEQQTRASLGTQMTHAGGTGRQQQFAGQQ
jgi:hypothetical protein